MRIKAGVELAGLARCMTGVIRRVGNIFSAHGYLTEITSGTEGEHGAGSKHYTGEALDFKANHIADLVEAALIKAEIKALLGRNFDVLLHGKGDHFHLHIEFDNRVGR